MASASALLEQRGYAELLRTIQEKNIEELDTDVMKIVSNLASHGDSLQSTAPAVVREFSELYRKHQLLLRPLMAIAAVDPIMAQVGKKFDERTKQQFRHLLLRHRNGIKHPNPERAVDTCFEVLFASVTHVLGLGTAPNVMGTAPKVKSKSIWRDFVEDLSEMVSSFLLSDLSGISEDELVALNAERLAAS